MTDVRRHLAQVSHPALPGDADDGEQRAGGADQHPLRGLGGVRRELTPYAADVPQWVLIGIAGTLLTVVGITWEHRMRDVRYAAGYLRRLQ